MSAGNVAVVDSWAILAFLRAEEPGATAMRRYLRRAQSGNLRLLLSDLLSDRRGLRPPDRRIGDIGLCSCQRSLRRLDPSFGGGHGGGLLICIGHRLFPLTFGDSARLRQARVRLFVERGQLK